MIQTSDPSKRPVAAGQRVLHVCAEWIAVMCQEGAMVHFRCVKGVPDNARLVSYGYDQQRDQFMLVFEHESWPVLGYLDVLPEQTVEMEVVM